MSIGRVAAGRNGMEQKKDLLHRAGCLLCLVLFCLLCAGCASPAAGPDPETGENAGTGEAAGGAEGSTPKEGAGDRAGVIPDVIPTAPLLDWEDPDNENLADMLQRQCGSLMVRLSAGTLQGSGVLFRTSEDMLWILTAAHVFAELPERVTITFADGWETESSEVDVAEDADIAMIQIPLERIPWEHREQYLCANVNKESFDALAAGDGCIAMGSRSGVAAEAYEGTVLEPWIYMEDYGQYMMWVRAEGIPGMSGGGLFDRQGHLLGILSGGNEDGELAVVPLSLVLAAFPPQLLNGAFVNMDSLTFRTLGRDLRRE